ncbi:hypothetical protein H6F75_27500 [Nodosilinea sp. FACHB-131]|uniref:hypothetical protein n=1 Tax=Cyanophyceae TaxID=3028117 RepID=UPI001689D11B|nr:hypothetical protein [Nodosilinea sp. FACHB-131]MBD1877232.1 hypothetical protein [Nodosilinea sp. FACHB-131]
MIALSMPLGQGFGGDGAMDLQNLGVIGGVGPRPVFDHRTLAAPRELCYFGGMGVCVSSRQAPN